MNSIEDLKQAFFSFIAKKFNISQEHIENLAFDINTDEQKQSFGDIATNAAMILAKQLGKNPRQIAQEIADHFKHTVVQRIEIAGPGFINIFLTNTAFKALACDLFAHPQTFFTPSSALPKYRYSLEFVSANPTGPLHLGHGRGGIIGDVLCNILRFLGNKVTKEYYINDAGSQIQKLGASFKIRCQQELGFTAQIPEEGYHGEYLIDLAKKCIKEHGKNILEKEDSFFENYAKEHMLEHIKQTLRTYGIEFDLWFSEKKLHDDGSVTKAIDILIERGYTYEKDGALWFKATEFNDDKDRVLRKQNGELTYIAGDVAYTENKFERDDRAIMILGQDHHSYVVRLKGIAQALGFNPNYLDVILYQLVTLKESGQLLRMSKRAGTMVTLHDVIETVGKDVARFFFLNRKADAHLDFDLDLALKKTEENPVYYIQYAYVRTKSILEKALEKDELECIDGNDAIGIEESEHVLLKKIISLKQLLANIGTNHQTHLLTYYVLELAKSFHAYYAKHKVIEMDNIPQSRARLLMVTLLKNTFELCLDLLGLDKPEKM
jgi:arginyl-tRNA synthetase